MCFSESIVVEDPRPRALVLWLCARCLRVCACPLWVCACCPRACVLCVRCVPWGLVSLLRPGPCVPARSWCGCVRPLVRVCALGVWVRARGCVLWVRVWVCVGMRVPPTLVSWLGGGWGACCFCVVVLWRCPTLPRPVDRSTIGVTGLSFQVRNVAGRFPGAMTTTNFVSNLTDPARHQRSRACVGVRVGGVG